MEADKEFLQKFKVRTPFDIAAYSAIKNKKVLGLGIENHSKILSEELHKPKRKNYLRRKIVVNHIDEIFAADLVELNRSIGYLFMSRISISMFKFKYPLLRTRIR